MKRMKDCKIRPLADKILLKRLDAEETTKGGIVLPDSAKEKPRRGTVIRLGDGKMQDDGTRSEFQVKAGDLVLFSSYGGTELKIDNEEYMIMDESDILAVLS